ncbi:MAG: site-specific integrase [Candidatus Obscuribacterales bacterium]|nr:site-specific integrase [Candidatus Obscuribacterales bacterium]
MAGQARILSPKEIKDIFRMLATPRDKAMFALGIYTGLRVSEIVTLRANQLFTESGNVRHVLKVKRKKKKNTVYSDIPVHEKLKKILADYYEHAEFDIWLFPSEAAASGHLTRAAAHNILTKAFESLGLEDASTHSMRRTCLTNMSRSGVPLRTIQEISGHASLSDLQAYLDVDPDDKRRAINLLRY